MVTTERSRFFLQKTARGYRAAKPVKIFQQGDLAVARFADKNVIPILLRKNLDEKLKRFTSEQLKALDSMRENPRVVFNGPAGTGKTLLAIEAARRSISDGCRTLFLCYNKHISEWVKSQFSDEDFHLITV